MLRAVIFDMDGVLIDSEPLHVRVTQAVMAIYGKELPLDLYVSMIGSNVRKIYEKLNDYYGLGADPDTLLAYSDRDKERLLGAEGYPEIPGAAELVRRLSSEGYLLAVASSSRGDTIDRILDQLKVRDLFQVRKSGYDIPHPKPAPDIFLNTAETLGVRPDECLVVEDSTNGVRAAKAAGMKCFGFANPSSFGQNVSSADFVEKEYAPVLEFPDFRSYLKSRGIRF